jgi:hypothetical protein
VEALVSFDSNTEAAVPCTIMVAPGHLAVLHDQEDLESLDNVSFVRSSRALQGRFCDGRRILIGTVVQDLLPHIEGVEELLLVRRLGTGALSGGFLPLTHI